MYLPHVFPLSLDCETSIHVILYRALSRDVTTLTSNQKLGASVLTFHVGHKWNVWLMANFFILHVYIISEGLIMQRQPGCLCFKCSTCVSSIRVSNDKVNLRDSWLYHNVIEKEVEEQVINLVGTNNYYGLQVVPVQQQNNGSDCRVFATAFCHMSDLWDSTTKSTI